MNYIEFAENERLSKIVLGMMRISQMSEAEVEALVEAALSIGINTFDLADIYGDGQCEVLLGKVLKRRPDLRDQMWIQSKCGIRKDGFTYFDFSKDYILDSVDGILERLQIERLDSLLLHRPDALMEPEEGPSFWGVQSKSHDDGIAQNGRQTTSQGQSVAVECSLYAEL